MNYGFWISLRYLLGRRKEKFISMISLISVIGIATGVATLIIVIGVMSGFDNELRDRIIGTSSHIVIDKLGGLDDPEEVMARLKGINDVIATAPFVNSQALLMDRERLLPVVIRGIDAKLEARVTSIEKFIRKGSLDLSGEDKIIIGKILAEQLLLKVGDEVQLISAGRISSRSFTVSAVFSSDMYDFDSGVVFMSLEKAQEFSGEPVVSGISVKVKDVYKADKVKRMIQKELGMPYFTRTWMDLNRNLFNALKLEKTAMFIILTLIVLVASLNIGSTLIMMVMEKTKDIGILKAIGATSKNIQGMFTMVGIWIGVLGTTIGAFGGIGASYLLKTYKFIKLPKDIYYIDTLPVKIDGWDVLLIVAAALAISLCATFYPAYQASKLNPVEALRYE